jgi:type I restriction enzyme, S subunit
MSDELCSLGDIATITIGRTPPRGSEKYWTSDTQLPFCSISDMRGREITPTREGVTPAAERDGVAKRVKAGTLLMSFKLTVGRVGFAGVDLFPNEAIAALSPVDRVHPSYLYYALQAVDFSSLTSDAVKGKTLNLAGLRAIRVPIRDLPEQRRIIDLLSSADRLVLSLEEQVADCKAARSQTLRGLLHKAQSFRLLPIAEVASLSYGKGVDPSHRSEVGFPYVASAGVVGFTRHPAVPNDVVVVGRKGNVGSVRLVRGGCSPSDTTFFLSPATSQVSVEYLAMSLEAAELGYLEQSSAVPGLSRTRLQNVVVPVPEPRRQSEMVSLLESTDRSLAASLDHLSAAWAVRSQVLNSLMSGATTIPDSYDRFLEGAEA